MAPKKKPSLSATQLPSYNKPPVNEVYCGIRLKTSDKIFIPHIGMLWNKFRSEYPVIQHANAVASVGGEVHLDKATGLPINRVWFINRTDDQLIQFQFDRFYFNWRRRDNDYPRYIHIIDKFEDVYKKVEVMFKEFDLGQLQSIETELCYINHIPKGQGWDTIDHLSKIFTDFLWKKTSKRFLPSPQKVSWTTDFPLPDNKGILNVQLREAIRTEDKTPLLVLTLTAKGNCKSTNVNELRQWFDLAHEWIVRGFTDITKPKIQEIWERKDNA